MTSATDPAGTSSTYDVIVVGLGGLGSATLHGLAHRGQRVLGIEQFELGHANGASHDTSRILRHSYHRRDYVALSKAAYDDWAALEQESGRQLVTPAGGLDFVPAGSKIDPRDYTDSLAAEDISCDVLDADELRRRWPEIRVADDTTGIWQERTSIVHAARTTSTLQRLAAAEGAHLIERSPVLAVEPCGDSVSVRTADATFTAARVMVCADAWTAKLLVPLGWSPNLTVLDQQVTYFQPQHRGGFELGAFPVWTWLDDPSFYGFPCFDGSMIKAGEDCGGAVVDPDNRSGGTDPVSRARLDERMDATFPNHGPARHSVRCLYTLPADRDFVLGPVPGQSNVFVALGAGHAFKFVPTIGRLMSERILSRHDPDHELWHAFRADRPALTDPDYPLEWVV